MSIYIKVFMIKYLRYSIHEIHVLSTLHGLNTVITLQYPWYSIHMTLSTLMYPWHSINFTVSVKSIHYIVFIIQRNRENEDNILISHMFKAFELYWSTGSILLQESPWVTSLLIWVMKFLFVVSVDFSIQVLSSGSWPFQQSADCTFTLPQEVSVSQDYI